MKLEKRIEALKSFAKTHPGKFNKEQHKLLKETELVKLWKSMSGPQQNSEVGQGLRSILLQIKEEQAKDEEEQAPPVETSENSPELDGDSMSESENAAE